MTSRETIASQLLSGHTLTTSKEVNELGIYGLPRLIAQLRRIGWEIDSRRVGVTNSVGDRVTVCEYWMRSRVKQPREWTKPI